MPDYKQNHYIPRFYMSNFTNDPNNKHGLFDFFNTKTPKYVGLIDHYPQMKEAYFYTKGSKIENLLDKNFEVKHSKLISKILNNEIVDNEEVLEIVLLMYFRTKHERDKTNAYRKFCIDEYLIKDVEPFRNYLSKKNPSVDFSNLSDDWFRENMKKSAYEEYLNQQETAEKNINNFKKINKEISGLKTVILRNDTSINLISSDHPVILINPFLQNRIKNFGTSGLFQMGVILLFPINPEHLIICFDNTIYDESFILTTSITDKNDIANLNKLQTIISKEGVYTRNFDPETLNEISKNVKNKVQPRIVSYQLHSDYYISFIDENLPQLEFTFIKEYGNVNEIKLHPPFARDNQ